MKTNICRKYSNLKAETPCGTAKLKPSFKECDFILKNFMHVNCDELITFLSITMNLKFN